MKLKFWGVRGSIASPGLRTAKYGGNTTCIEVRTDEGDLIILDGGTGIYPLAQTLFPEMPLTVHLFITHRHWDHIQGLPFFIPIFIPGNKIRLYGPTDFVTGNGIERIIEVQLQYSYFPVREAEVKANFEYFTLTPSQTVQAGSATVTSVLLNHPVVNFGYRIDCGGKSIFFTGDHEKRYNIYSPEDEAYAECQAHIDEQEKAYIEAMKDVDILICDSSYTSEEYPAKKGWGHGTFDSCIEMAKKARAKILYCTHHEPTRSDDDLEREFAKALSMHPHRDGDPEYRLAREGVEIEV